MPFKLNGNIIDINRDLTIGDSTDAITYPAASLQNAALRVELGITEEADPVRADDRYYWNGDISTPKDIETLKSGLIEQVKRTANDLLAPTDWQVTRKFERGVEIAADVATYRAAVIVAAADNEAAITASTTVERLASLALEWPASKVATD